MEIPILTVETTGNYVKVSGEVDFSTAVQLTDAVSMTTTELDLSGVTCIDSTGLRTLLVLRRQRPALRIVAVAPAVQRILEITATTELILGDPMTSGRAVASTT